MADNSLILSPIYLYILPIYPSIADLPRWIKVKNSIFPNSKYEPYTIGSTLGLPKFTKYIRDITYIPSYHLSVLVGLLLSDAGLSKQKKKFLEMLD